MNGNPVANHLSVKSPLKDTNLNSLMLPISAKVDVEVTIHTVRVPLVLCTNVVPCLNVSRAVSGWAAIRSVPHVRGDTTPPNLISESIRISDMKQLIPGFVTQVIVGMTTTMVINLPVPLVGHSKKIDNMVKTLITVHNWGIELRPRDSAIILAAKVSVTLQFLTPLAAVGFNLDAELTLGTDPVIGRKGHVERLSLPIPAVTVISVIATITHNLAINRVHIPTKVGKGSAPVRGASACQSATVGTDHVKPLNALGAKPRKDGTFGSSVVTVTTTTVSSLCYCWHSIKSS
jgi:hypothetical protein